MRSALWLLAVAPSLALAQPKNLEALYERVDPAVVTLKVGIKQITSTDEGYDVKVGLGTGSGVVLHSDGFIVTAAHVVEPAETVIVEFKDGTRSEAKIVTLSRTEDLALLKVEKLPKGVTPVLLADSDQVKVGQSVFSLGAPLGLNHTLTSGVVSSIRKHEKRGLLPAQVIQTDAALNPGNSGGALFNDKGEVIGIASYIATTSGGSQSLGFAVPANVVRKRLFEHPLPWFGVSLRHLPPEVTQLFNWPYESVMLIERVAPGTVAELAGLKGGSTEALIGGTPVRLGGDVIVKVGEYESHKTAEIGAYLGKLKEGDTVHYEVLRGGKVTGVDVLVPQQVKVPRLEGPKKK